MAIKENASGDDLIYFVGKMPEDLIKNRFNWKKRLCFDLLNDYSEKGLLEIVPKSFERDDSRIYFLSRHDGGVYLEYRGNSENYGAGNFYAEKLQYWIPADYSPAEEILEDFKEGIHNKFKEKIISNPLHIPSKKEVEKLNLEREKYFEAIQTRDLVSG